MREIDEKLGQAEAIENDDMDYVTDATLAALHEKPKVTAYILYTLSVFFLVVIVWAALTEMDEIIRGEAQAIPSAKVQEIQNLEGGILKARYVEEGQTVAVGDILLELDDTQASAFLIKSETEYLAAMAKAARLEAVVNNTEPQYNEILKKKAQQFIRAENRLLKLQRKEHQSAVRVVELEMQEARQELDSVRQQVSAYRQQIKLTQEQRDINEPLVRQGAVPAIELLDIDRSLSELKLQLTNASNTVPQVESKLERLQAKKDGVEEEFQGRAQQELAEVRAAIEIASAGRSSSQDRATRTQIRAPVTGVVKKINVTTIGGVVQPGMTMLEIVPVDDEIIFEAKVQPKDIGFVRIGLPGRVKVSAYEFATYGGLDAQVTQVSADTLFDEVTGAHYYLVKLKVLNSLTDSRGGDLPIIPGMQASVDIQVGKKTVLTYFFKPVLRMVKS